MNTHLSGRLYSLISISLFLGGIAGYLSGLVRYVCLMQATGYRELGMRDTAGFYLWTYMDDSLYCSFRLAAGVFIALVILSTLAKLTRLERLIGEGNRSVLCSTALILAGLLFQAGFQLNRDPLYPKLISLGGFIANGFVVSVFFFSGVLIFRQIRRNRYSLLIGLFGAMVAAALAANLTFHQQRTKSPIVFTDVTEQAGIREVNNSLGVAWGDFDHDGWTDLYVSNHLPITARSYLYRNGKGRFSTIPLTVTGDYHGAAWGDFDNDDDLDLFVAGGNNTPEGPSFPNRLFRNDGGAFSDMARAAGVEDKEDRGWGGAWADIDNDGCIDLFVANYFTSNALYLNKGDGTFENIARSAGISDSGPGEPSTAGTLCATWADFDRDGDMDLLTTAVQRGPTLYRNDGNREFTDVTVPAGLITDGRWGTEEDPRGLSGCAWGDYDNDGDLDLYMGAFGRNYLFNNRGDGSFVEVGGEAGVDIDAHARAALWGDYDNDGDLDLYVVIEASDRIDIPFGDDPHGWNRLFLNQGDGRFVGCAEAGGALGFPFVREGTCAQADYDNDGFLDIFLNNQRELKGRPPGLTRNILLRNTGNRGHWLEVQLRGTTSNRDGIGAKVYLDSGARRQFREQGGGYHIFAQNSPILHFGLGNERTVDRLIVEWPSGRVQTLSDIAPDRLIVIVEASGSS